MPHRNKINYEKMFFGDNELQKAVVDRLANSLEKHEKVIHYITGGQRFGKSSTIKKALAKLKQSNSIVVPDKKEAQEFWEKNPELVDVLVKLSHPFTRAEEFGTRTIAMADPHDYKLFRDNEDPPHYILNITQEISLPNHEKLMGDFIEAFKKTENLTIIMDAFISSMPLIPGKQSFRQGLRFQSHAQSLEKLANHPELKIYHLEYSMEQIKETLWNHRNDDDIDYLKGYIALNFNIVMESPKWLRVFNALEKGKNIRPEDKEAYAVAKGKYDREFHKLAELQRLGALL